MSKYKIGNIVYYGGFSWIVLDIDNDEGIIMLLSTSFISCDERGKLKFPFCAHEELSKVEPHNFHTSEPIQKQLKLLADDLEHYEKFESKTKKVQMVPFNISASISYKDKKIDFGVKSYKVGLLTLNQYYNYKDIINQYSLEGPWWLATPDCLFGKEAVCAVYNTYGLNSASGVIDLSQKLYLRPVIMLRVLNKGVSFDE